MSFTTPNIGLTVWNSAGDQFNYTELANNFITLDDQFSSVSVFTTPVRFIEMLAVVPSPGTQGRLIYLTANNSGFVANTILRDNGTSWAPVGPPEIQSGLPTNSNFAGRMVVLSAPSGGFSAWDVVINTDGANSWQVVGGVSRSTTVAGFTNNYAGKLGVLTAADSGFDAYSLLIFNGTSWQAVDTRGVLTGPTLPVTPYTGQLFVLTAAQGNYSAYDVMEWNGSYWRVVSDPPLLTTAQFAALATPNDGFRVDLKVDGTLGIVWPLRYNAASASIYKWEVIGGASPLFTYDSDDGTVTAASYTDLTGSSVGPSLTLPFGGDYMVEIGCVAAPAPTYLTIWHGYMSYTENGTATDANSITCDSSYGTAIMGIQRKNSLNAQTLTCKYKITYADGNSATFQKRWIKATPIRIRQT